MRSGNLVLEILATMTKLKGNYQLSKKGDELVMVVVKVVHELDCRMVVMEIEDGLLEEIEKFGWWFEQDIKGENEDDNEKKLVMVIEEGCIS
ncbi:hypothetical protein Tco_1069266 [Tanacetum coccineum]|uniref:Uncharacterized protein n=1 Tax=Tanacetum coccineum TaxID=301880 RepID=A0ABQ5HI90_9ASTR